jgi:hypothetical protein
MDRLRDGHKKALIQNVDQGLVYYLESLTLHNKLGGEYICIVRLPLVRHSFVYKFQKFLKYCYFFNTTIFAF